MRNNFFCELLIVRKLLFVILLSSYSLRAMDPPSSTVEKSCGICLDSYTNKELLVLHDSADLAHVVCADCLKQVLVVAVEKYKKGDIVLQCPYKDCKVPLNVNSDSLLMLNFAEQKNGDELVKELGRAQKSSDKRLAHEAEGHFRSSQCYLCGQYWKATAKCMCCTSCCGCLCPDTFTHNNIEHCPECHARYRTISGCTHMTCENNIKNKADEIKPCYVNFERGQQANIPFLCCVFGCYWRYLGLSLLALPCCPCISAWLHYGMARANPSCWCLPM